MFFQFLTKIRVFFFALKKRLFITKIETLFLITNFLRIKFKRKINQKIKNKLKNIFIEIAFQRFVFEKTIFICFRNIFENIITNENKIRIIFVDVETTITNFFNFSIDNLTMLIIKQTFDE